MNNIETMKLALEALEKQVQMANGWQSSAEAKAITALRQAIEQAQQAELVACGYDETTGNCTNNPCCYSTPPPRQPLTDEEIEAISAEIERSDFFDCVVPFARAIEAAHGIKGEA